MRILYVEDNLANVSLVRRVARGHELIHYVDGEEALAAFNIDNPDFVLMDVQLAGNMTGLDVVRSLRASGHTLPIIAVTAYAMVGDRERCIEAGCDDYMSKPLDVGKLVTLLQTYSESAKSAPPNKTAEIQPSKTTLVGEEKSAEVKEEQKTTDESIKVTNSLKVQAQDPVKSNNKQSSEQPSSELPSTDK